MIQRIQSLYLLVAELLVGCLFIKPFAKLVDKGGSEYTTDMLAVNRLGANSQLLQSNTLLTILGGAILILILLTIFRYKNRKNQQKLALIGLLGCLVANGSMFLQVRSLSEQLSGISTFTLIFVFPIIAAVFILMAIKGIRKDDALVRSVDRIR
ncbi:MAG: DUF4293 domain-containing protein [Bacteroidia bacterium]|nr:DUF4293 domain-containing protein [Bacteroidia bacterium]